MHDCAHARVDARFPHFRAFRGWHACFHGPGCYELTRTSALCMEYQTHLDLQGLGITALQVPWTGGSGAAGAWPWQRHVAIGQRGPEGRPEIAWDLATIDHSSWFWPQRAEYRCVCASMSAPASALPSSTEVVAATDRPDRHPIVNAGSARGTGVALSAGLLRTLFSAELGFRREASLQTQVQLFLT